MRCPACQEAIDETATTCVCGFSMTALDKLLGVPPILHGAVTDFTEELSRGETRRITHEIERLERLFPQLQFAIVFCQVPENATLPLYTFWLFNRGGLSSAVERGSQNRLIMLTIDIYSARAVTMIGYGLEPFVSEARLASALNAAAPFLMNTQLTSAIDAYLAELERQLVECVENIPQTYGLGEVEYQGLSHFLDSLENQTVTY